MKIPTWLTIFERWPSMVDEVFPNWSKQRVSRAMARVIGPDWKDCPFPIALVRLAKQGLLDRETFIDEDPKDTLVKIRDLSDRLLLDELAAEAARQT